MKLTPIALAIAGTLYLGTAARATPVDQAEARADTKAEAPQAMDTVVVSARRRDERLQDVPLAVTAFSAKELERQNVQNLGDLQQRVPNLTAYASRGTNTTLTAFIRGVGQADPVWGSDPGVGIYMDDVYMARPQGALLDVFDVQRIEVLRGPQGTLYGKNTIGGAIKYVSRPLAPSNGGSAEIGMGNYAQRSAKAALNAASEGGEWRARVALAALRRDGFGRNLTTGADVSDQHTDAARVSLGYYASQLPLTVLLSADGADDDSHMRGFQRMAPNAFDPLKRPASGSRYDIASGMPDRNLTYNRGAALHATYAPAGAWTWKAIAAKRRSRSAQTIDFDGLPLPIADVYGDSSDRQRSLELQALRQGELASGVIGLYRFSGSAGGRIFNNFLARQFTATDSTVDTRSTAIYTDWSARLGADWELSGGLRHTREEKRAVVLNRAFSDAAFSIPVMTLADFDKSLAVSNTSPRLALGYRAANEVRLYASASRGFKSGGYNVRANNLAVPDASHPYRDEKLDALELGAKYAAASGALDVNLALFSNRYRDIQLSVFTSYTQANGTPGFYGDFTNAGRGKVRGAELEFAWRPAPQWSVNGFAAWMDAGYDEYLSGGKNVAAQQRFSNTPRAQLGLNLIHTGRQVFGGELRSMLGYGYRSKVYPTTDLSETIAQPGYGLWQAGVTWEAGRWSVGLHGSNLTDVHYRTDGYNIPAVSVLNGFYGPPRQVGARLGYRF